MHMKQRLVLIFGLLFAGIITNGCEPLSLDLQVQGVVWSDDNENGYMDPGEKGIPDVEVWIENDDPENPRRIPSVKTDGNGEYIFDFSDYNSAGWIVYFEKKDFRRFTEPIIEKNPADPRKSSDVDETGKSIWVISATVDNRVVNAGLLPIANAQALAPTPTATPTSIPTPSATATSTPIDPSVQTYQVSGRVYLDYDRNSLYSSSQDEFMQGVEVLLIQAGTGKFLQDTVTDADGRYEFIVPQPDGPVLVQVNPDNPDLAFSPPSEGAAEAYPVQVLEDGISTRELAFQAEEQTINAGLQYPNAPEEVFVYNLKGEPVDPGPLAGIVFDVVAEGEGITIIATLPDGQVMDLICLGVDFTAEGQTLAAPDPEFPLAEDNLMSVSACFQAGSLVGVSGSGIGPQGEIVSISSNADASMDENQVRLLVPPDEFTALMTGIRPAASDGERYSLYGNLAENNGYVPFDQFGEEVVDILSNGNGTRSCDVITSTCVIFEDGIDWERTGEQSVSITIDGKPYTGQFYAAPGTEADRIDDIAQVGWGTQAHSTLQTQQRNWQILVMHANGAPYGVLLVSENGSSANPYSFVINLVGESPLSEQELAKVVEMGTHLAQRYRSGFETLE